jgi:hypothetical protein
VLIFVDSSDDDDNDNNNENSRINDNISHNAVRRLASSSDSFSSIELSLAAQHIQPQTIVGDHYHQTRTLSQEHLQHFPRTAHIVNDGVGVFTAVKHTAQNSEPRLTEAMRITSETKSAVIPSGRIFTRGNNNGVKTRQSQQATLQLSRSNQVTQPREQPTCPAGTCFSHMPIVEHQEMNIVAAAAATTRVMGVCDGACRLSSHCPHVSNDHKGADYSRFSQSDEQRPLLNASSARSGKSYETSLRQANVNRVTVQRRSHHEESVTNQSARTSQRHAGRRDRNRLIQEAQQCDQERYSPSGIRQSPARKIDQRKECTMNSLSGRRHQRERERSGVVTSSLTPADCGRHIDADRCCMLYRNSSNIANSQIDKRQQREALHQVSASMHIVADSMQSAPVIEHKPPLPNKSRPYSAMRLRSNNFRQVIENTPLLSADREFTNHQSLSNEGRDVFNGGHRGAELSQGTTVVLSADYQPDNTSAFIATAERRQSFGPDRTQNNNSNFVNINVHDAAVRPCDTTAAVSTSASFNAPENEIPYKKDKRVVRDENKVDINKRVAQSSATKRYDRHSSKNSSFSDDDDKESSSSSSSDGYDVICDDDDDDEDDDDDTSSSACSDAEESEEESSSGTAWSKYSGDTTSDDDDSCTAGRISDFDQGVK